MAVEVVLVRHGAHGNVGRRLTGRDADGGLSPDGLAQVADLAEWLGQSPLDAVIASPRGRTQETADAIAAPHKLEVLTNAGFDEVDFGVWTGMRFDTLKDDPQWQHWNTARATASTPGGETMTQAQDRAWGALIRVSERYHDAVVAIVTHCDIIRALVARVLRLSLDHILSFDVDPASMTRLAVGSWGARVTGLNQMAPAR